MGESFSSFRASDKQVKLQKFNVLCHEDGEFVHFCAWETRPHWTYLVGRLGSFRAVVCVIGTGT